MPVHLTCSTCGSPLVRKAYRVRAQNFCNYACRGLWPPRTYTVSDDGVTATIPICRNDGSVVAYTLVDADTADWVNQWRWGLLRPGGYAIRGQHVDGRGIVVYLHRELLGLKPGDEQLVDHINRDKLDNRRTNLRPITRQGNPQNVPSQSGSSEYRGVYWAKTRRMWVAQISLTEHGRRRCFNLGGFDTEAEAAEAARAARAIHFPYSTD